MYVNNVSAKKLNKKIFGTNKQETEISLGTLETIFP